MKGGCNNTSWGFHLIIWDRAVEGRDEAILVLPERQAQLSNIESKYIVVTLSIGNGGPLFLAFDHKYKANLKQ